TSSPPSPSPRSPANRSNSHTCVRVKRPRRLSCSAPCLRRRPVAEEVEEGEEVEEVEEPLSGGNLSASVVRIGATVRRPTGPWTPAVHALLGHLADVGFDGAPRVLGFDDAGREILEYIEGEVPWQARHHD